MGRGAFRNVIFSTHVGMNRRCRSGRSSGYYILHACGDEPDTEVLANLRLEIFSTHVGMNRTTAKHPEQPTNILHACGDEPDAAEMKPIIWQYSPRMWG